MALIWVAITDSPTAHHGSDRDARKYPSTALVPFARLIPSYRIQTRYPTTMSQSIACITSGDRSQETGDRFPDAHLLIHGRCSSWSEVAGQIPERNEGRELNQDDRSVGAGHDRQYTCHAA